MISNSPEAQTADHFCRQPPDLQRSLAIVRTDQLFFPSSCFNQNSATKEKAITQAWLNSDSYLKQPDLWRTVTLDRQLFPLIVSRETLIVIGIFNSGCHSDQPYILISSIFISTLIQARLTPGGKIRFSKQMFHVKHNTFKHVKQQKDKF